MTATRLNAILEKIVLPYTYGSVRAWKFGNIVSVYADYDCPSSTGWRTVETLPIGLRPEVQLEIPAVLANTGANVGMMRVNTDGKVAFYAPTASKVYKATVSYGVI